LAFSFAHHGEEVLAVLDAEPDIELLLLDIKMPVNLAWVRAKIATRQSCNVSAR
jgi:CheY-like chemotaxis protein